MDFIIVFDLFFYCVIILYIFYFEIVMNIIIPLGGKGERFLKMDTPNLNP